MRFDLIIGFTLIIVSFLLLYLDGSGMDVIDWVIWSGAVIGSVLIIFTNKQKEAKEDE